MRKSTILAAFILLVVFALPAFTQTYSGYSYDAGNPSWGVNIPVENGYINVANGNLHLEFSISQLPQRGSLSLNERLVYDSHFWMIGHYSNYYWWPDNVPRNDHLAAGWRFVSGANTGSLNNAFYMFSTDYCAGGTGGMTQTGMHNYTWQDPSGTSHFFYGGFGYYYSDCDPTSPASYPTSSVTYSNDAAGYIITATGDSAGDPTIVIRDTHGNQVYPVMADRYGNFWSSDGNGDLVDSRGLTPVVTSYNGNQIYYDVLRQGGGRVRYTVTTVQINPHTQFNEQAVSEYPNGSNAQTLNAVQSIELPDHSMYSFEYDSTFGMLTKMTLPTGGVIQYGYSTFFDSYNNANRWLTSRQVGSDPASTFTPAVISTCGSSQVDCHEQVTVHEPGGDETVYDQRLNAGAWNTSTYKYSGTVNPSSLLSTTTTEYTFNNSCDSMCYYGVGAQNVTASSTTTTLSDTNLSRTDAFEYVTATALGLLKKKKMYDFYSGSLPSQPLSQTEYFYDANTGIPGDVSDVKGEDGAGNVVSWTKYAYTTSAQATSGLAGHDLAKSVGVYPQSTSQWVNTDGSFLTTQVSLDDAGTDIGRQLGHSGSTGDQCAARL